MQRELSSCSEIGPLKRKSLLGPIKNFIRDANKLWVRDMQKRYDEDPKNNRKLGIQLAYLYMRGKRVDRDIEKAIELFSSSPLTEAKYRLMEIYYKKKQYSAVYYYNGFMSISSA